MIGYKELAPMIMGIDKSPDLQSVLEAQDSDDVAPVQRQETTDVPVQGSQAGGSPLTPEASTFLFY